MSLRNKKNRLTAKALQEGYIETKGTGDTYACLFFASMYFVMVVEKLGPEDRIVSCDTYPNLKTATTAYNKVTV